MRPSAPTLTLPRFAGEGINRSPRAALAGPCPRKAGEGDRDTAFAKRSGAGAIAWRAARKRPASPVTCPRAKMGAPHDSTVTMPFKYRTLQTNKSEDP